MNYWDSSNKFIEQKMAEIAANSVYGISNIDATTIHAGDTCSLYMPQIDKVIFHDPATIVLWSDGTKTVVKCGENDIFDPEKGLAMAISKKALGNKGNYYEKFKEWLPDEEECETVEISNCMGHIAQGILNGALLYCDEH